MNNRESITRYYIAHRDELLAYVGSRLGDAATAEDLVQDVFTRLLTSDKLITETTLPCLCYTIAHNLLVDYHRRHSIRTEYEHYIRRSADADCSMESVFSAQEIVERMERGLARLPQGCRDIYRMHVIGGMKVSEIAQATGEGYKRVENRLGLARREIRKLFKRVS